jgi:sec-independent protein translocase protein TatA
MTTGIFLFLNIGTSEMMLILFVALFLFGGKKLPELARGLGRGIREFKDASETIKRDINEQINNFEEEIKDVKTDIKSIAEESVSTVEGSMSEASEGSDAAEPEPLNMDHQNDISHSDQYYKNYNYDYDYPEEITTDSSSEPSASELNPKEDTDNKDSN